jgi:hypothetical protein
VKTGLLQIGVALVASAFIVNGVAKYARRERNQTLFKLVASGIVWGSVACFSLFPSWAHAISERAGFGQNLNTLIFIGFIVVFAILFKLLAIIERLEVNLSELVRRDALAQLPRATPADSERDGGVQMGDSAD